jgi:hypothetical protein
MPSPSRDQIKPYNPTKFDQMNRPIDPTILQNNPGRTIPAIFQAIARPAPLLPGESLHDFESIRAIIIDDLKPQSGLEWLWTMDLIDISWDIVRYRSLRQKVLETYREAAIESVLQRLDLAGISNDFLQSARKYTKQNAAQWRADPQAAAQIERRLASNGIDTETINLEVLVQSRELFLMFDALIQSAQNRRAMLLREINNRRSSARKS